MRSCSCSAERRSDERSESPRRSGSCGIVASPPLCLSQRRSYSCSVVATYAAPSLRSSPLRVANTPLQTIITALNTWTMSVLSMPWFHADVHAGNLLVTKGGDVAFIDFGITGQISPSIFEAVTNLSGALAEGDYRGMAAALAKMGATEDGRATDIDKVRSGEERKTRVTTLRRLLLSGSLRSPLTASFARRSSAGTSSASSRA